jgi:exopolysaccharide biosynthesis polyprenyl glycosylphosphotransferase
VTPRPSVSPPMPTETDELLASDVFDSPALASSTGRGALTATSFKALLVVGDMAAVATTLALLAWANGGMPLSPTAILLVAAAQLIGLYLVEAYEERVYREYGGLPTRVLLAAAIPGMLAGGAMLGAPWLEISPGAALGYSLFGVPVFLTWRWGGARLVRESLRPRRIAVVGSGDLVGELIGAFAESPAYAVSAVIGVDSDGLADLQGRMQDGERAPAYRSERIQNLSAMLHSLDIDMVAVAETEDARKAFLSELVACRCEGIEVRDMATSLELLRQRLPLRHLEPDWVAFSSRFVGWDRDFEERGKRMIDFAVALVGLLVTTPLLIAVGAAVRLTSPGPAIYSQVRVGRGGATYTLYKFRSMRGDAEARGPVWATESDSRATWFGSFLRKSHLDELPQLVNVLRGEMSLVGPRPERPEFVAELRKKIPYYDLRHVVKPGVTGWAQVRLRYGASADDAAAKLEYDLYYIRHKSLLWDLRIILRTITVSVLGRGSR